MSDRPSKPISNPRIDGPLVMAESYEGVVEEVAGDSIVVVYDVDGKIVEQTYKKSQFIDGRLPDIGTRLAVHVNVVEVLSKSIESGGEELEPHGDSAVTRRRLLSGPIEF